MTNTFIRAAVLAAGVLTGGMAAAQSPAPNPVRHQPAVKAANPLRDMMLSATRAGRRIVAVGERGVVLLSDDDGANWRQARTVPTRATLTAVRFVDQQAGWAVGHWGSILVTEDGGETWRMQRDDLSTDQPLFSVWFRDRQNGLAAGLFSLLLATTDGGKTWSKVTLPAPAGARSGDLNLFSIFSDRKGQVWIAAEQGTVYRSADGGHNWDALATGARGTFWTGIALDDGAILVGGLSGNLYRSADDGASWSRLESMTRSSITDMMQLANGDVMAVALDGVTLVSDNRAASFRERRLPTQSALTALTVNSRGMPVIFSQTGLVRND